MTVYARVLIWHCIHHIFCGIAAKQSSDGMLGSGNPAQEDQQSALSNSNESFESAVSEQVVGLAILPIAKVQLLSIQQAISDSAACSLESSAQAASQNSHVKCFDVTKQPSISAINESLARSTVFVMPPMPSKGSTMQTHDSDLHQRSELISEQGKALLEDILTSNRLTVCFNMQGELLLNRISTDCSWPCITTVSKSISLLTHPLKHLTQQPGLMQMC